jgi:hypothetical protein
MTPESWNSSLLANVLVNTFQMEENTCNSTRAVFSVVHAALIVMQWCGKHISAAVNHHAIIEEVVFSVGATPRLYDEDLKTAEKQNWESLLRWQLADDGGVEFQSSKWAVSWELSSMKISKKRWQLQQRNGLQVSDLEVGWWWRSWAGSVESWSPAVKRRLYMCCCTGIFGVCASVRLV